MDKRAVIKDGDVGTRELRQHKQVRTYVDEDGQLKARIKHASILEEYYNRDIINQDQFCAGSKMYHHYVSGVMKQFPSVTPAYEFTRGSSSKRLEVTEHQAHLIKEFHKALKKLSNDEKIIIMHVCCEEKHVGLLAKNPRHRKKQMEVLKRALDKLVAFFTNRRK